MLRVWNHRASKLVDWYKSELSMHTSGSRALLFLGRLEPLLFFSLPEFFACSEEHRISLRAHPRTLASQVEILGVSKIGRLTAWCRSEMEPNKMADEICSVNGAR